MKVLYIDMDGVVANFDKTFKLRDPTLDTNDGPNYEERSARVYKIALKEPNIFLEFEPIEGSIEAINKLFNHFNIYFLSTPMWDLPTSFTDKRLWLEKYFGEKVKDRLILTKRKDLNIGDYLIDDTTRNGVDKFTGEHLHFGTKDYPDWDSILKKLIN